VGEPARKAEPEAALPPQSEAPADENNAEKRMPFLEHLAELRTTLRNSIMAVLFMTVVAYVFRVHLFELLARPLIDAWVKAQQEVGLGKAEFVFTSPMEPFMVLFKLSLVVGVFAASPVIFRELWRFISPGLYPRERRWGLVFIVSSVVLFIGGATFAYMFVLPAGYKYFLGYSQSSLGEIKEVLGRAVEVRLSMPFDIKPMLTMQEYFGLTSMLLLVFGCVFELPLLLSILSMLGIVSAKTLWKFNRYAILVFAVAGAILTPGDLVIGQLAMTGALTVLYNLSIILAVIVGKKRKEADEEAAAAAE
jgi:sec-independent protein translocase protein TatC